MRILSLQLAVLSLIYAQDLKFDVASIKPIPSDRFTDRSLLTNGRTLRASATLDILVRWSYRAEDLHLEGLPEWIYYQFYSITAKSEGDAPLTIDEQRQMLRALLAERFRLKVHSETQETPVYALVVDKNGSKLSESALDVARSEKRFNGRLEVTHYTIDSLVHRLRQELDRKVIDLTGLGGSYDFKLEWAPESAADSSDPSIFTAVRMQLGLRLEARKVPVQILIINHAEKPLAN